MRNKSLLIALGGAVVFGLIAAVSVSRYVSQARAYAEDLGRVVVAKDSIQLGTKITPDMLTTASMPNGSKPEGAFDSIEKVAGRVAIANIGVREPVTNLKLAIEGAAGGLPAVIPDGYRAMTVKVDDVVGVSGFIMPGAFVDVVAVVTQQDQNGGQNPISKVVLQNIKVLASGAKIDQPTDGREPNAVKAVTLQVLPDEAEKLALAATEGKLQLVMRNYGDQEAAVTGGASKRSLLTGEAVSYATQAPPAAAKPAETKPATTSQPRARYVMPRAEAPAPAAQAAPPPQPPTRSVELIEGGKKQNVQFP
jgi:pilus assembly protein CpaB